MIPLRILSGCTTTGYTWYTLIKDKDNNEICFISQRYKELNERERYIIDKIKQAFEGSN